MDEKSLRLETFIYISSFQNPFWWMVLTAFHTNIIQLWPRFTSCPRVRSKKSSHSFMRQRRWSSKNAVSWSASACKMSASPISAFDCRKLLFGLRHAETVQPGDLKSVKVKNIFCLASSFLYSKWWVCFWLNLIIPSIQLILSVAPRRVHRVQWQRPGSPNV